MSVFNTPSIQAPLLALCPGLLIPVFVTHKWQSLGREGLGMRLVMGITAWIEFSLVAKVKSTAAEGSISTHIWRQQEVCHGLVCGHVAQETWLLTLNPCTLYYTWCPTGFNFQSTSALYSWNTFLLVIIMVCPFLDHNYYSYFVLGDRTHYLTTENFTLCIYLPLPRASL